MLPIPLVVKLVTIPVLILARSIEAVVTVLILEFNCPSNLKDVTIPVNLALPMTSSFSVGVAEPIPKLVPELILTVPTPTVGPIFSWVLDPERPSVPRLIILVFPEEVAPAWISVVCDVVDLPNVINPVPEVPPNVSVPVVWRIQKDEHPKKNQIDWEH